MAVIPIQTSLKSKNFQTNYQLKAIQKNHQLQYIEDNCKMVIDITRDCVTMVRKNDEYEIVLSFHSKKSSGLIRLSSGHSLPLEMTVKKLEIQTNTVIIQYVLYGEEYEYKIQY